MVMGGVRGEGGRWNLTSHQCVREGEVETARDSRAWPVQRLPSHHGEQSALFLRKEVQGTGPRQVPQTASP